MPEPITAQRIEQVWREETGGRGPMFVLGPLQRVVFKLLRHAKPADVNNALAAELDRSVANTSKAIAYAAEVKRQADAVEAELFEERAGRVAAEDALEQERETVRGLRAELQHRRLVEDELRKSLREANRQPLSVRSALLSKVFGG